MPRPLRVWGWTSHPWRAVVATRTKREAARHYNGSYYHFNVYAAETGNAEEVAAATAQPGRCLARSQNWRGPFTPIATCGECRIVLKNDTATPVSQSPARQPAQPRGK